MNTFPYEPFLKNSRRAQKGDVPAKFRHPIFDRDGYRVADGPFGTLWFTDGPYLGVAGISKPVEVWHRRMSIRGVGDDARTALADLAVKLEDAANRLEEEGEELTESLRWFERADVTAKEDARHVQD